MIIFFPQFSWIFFSLHWYSAVSRNMIKICCRCFLKKMIKWVSVLCTWKEIEMSLSGPFNSIHILNFLPESCDKCFFLWLQNIYFSDFLFKLVYKKEILWEINGFMHIYSFTHFTIKCLHCSYFYTYVYLYAHCENGFCS